jgi:hypothetical protein
VVDTDNEKSTRPFENAMNNEERMGDRKLRIDSWD